MESPVQRSTPPTFPPARQIDAEIARRFGRRLLVLGCALESDAHTVGLDAIFNMKGFAGDYGLERYHGFDARNLGAQVPVADLARRVRETAPDAVLVSATVTQNEIHVRHLTDLVDMLEAEGLRDRVTLVVGGARIDHGFARELGYDAGFGPGTKPSRVAAFLLEEISRRMGSGSPGGPA
jgi:beta-lysine 5,6-aminomutase beta subunit